MSNKTSNNIEELESKIAMLIELTQQLSADNSALKQELHGLKTSRSGLVTQKELVRTQVEGMISRLKAMESA